MRRPLLITITMLGALVCLLGGTGLFAALNDTAETGENSATSDGLPTSIHLLLASGSLSAGVITCGAFDDDLTSGLFHETDLRPGNNGLASFCLRNDGAQTAAHVNVRSFELADIDHDCTGDEADSGDTTCGDDKAGELSDVLSVAFTVLDCATGQEVDGTGEVGLGATVGSPLDLPAVAAGGTLCVKSQLSYRDPADPGDAQRAQSDTATWRFRFTAST